jgi:tRNA dimethylallyltransferase
MQVYRFLDIGSAKPSKEMMKRIPHHLIDILDPWSQFTVGSFIEEADKAVKEIQARGKVPVITGGTAYYFKHFLFGLSSLPIADPKIREEVAGEIKEKGGEWAVCEVAAIDPVSSSRIAPNDIYRLSRVIEVKRQTGLPLSSFALPSTPRNGMKPLIIDLQRDKEELNERIAKRVDIMLEEGLLGEIRKLCEMGADLTWPGMQGIGYKEFMLARENGECNLDTLRDEIISNSRKYAKRQNTFFKTFPDVHFLHPENLEAISKLVSDYELQ